MKKTMISQKSNGHSNVTSDTRGRNHGKDSAYIGATRYDLAKNIDLAGGGSPNHGGVNYKGVSAKAF